MPETKNHFLHIKEQIIPESSTITFQSISAKLPKPLQVRYRSLKSTHSGAEELCFHFFHDHASPIVPAINHQNGSFSHFSAFLRVALPLVKPGIVIPVWYYETSGSKPGTFRTSPVLTKQHVPTFADVYKQVYGKYPSGPKWEAFVLINDIASAMLRAVMLPHGSPKEAVDDLRKAFAALPEDKGFVSDYEKIIRTTPELVTYKEGEAILSKLNGVNPDTVALLKKVAGMK